jgi:hypothetical protein
LEFSGAWVLIRYLETSANLNTMLFGVTARDPINIYSGGCHSCDHRARGLFHTSTSRCKSRSNGRLEIRMFWSASPHSKGELMIQDFKYGIRMLRQKPTYTVIAIGDMALGIGATTSLFSVVNAVLLRPLPYPNAKTARSRRPANIAQANGWRENPNFSTGVHMRNRLKSAAAYSGFGGADGNLTGGG